MSALWDIASVPTGPCKMCGCQTLGSSEEYPTTCDDCRAYLKVFGATPQTMRLKVVLTAKGGRA
jgi:hypothetical protein